MQTAERTATQRLLDVARDPRPAVEAWKAARPDRRVIGVLPMNFPRELVHAAGALAVVVQDDQRPVTEGRALLAEFYCGYTRNLADQAATGRLDLYDAVLMADHCIQLVGAADVVRMVVPETPVRFGMLNSALDDSWADDRVLVTLQQLRDDVEELTGRRVTDGALRESARAYNRCRALLRRLFDERRAGNATFSPTVLQGFVLAAMAMDPVEFHDLLVAAIDEAAAGGTRDDGVRVHLSGHLCHAPRRELLEAIEDSGAVVVDDDLYVGRRFVSADVDEVGDPLVALGRWYRDRNVAIPCPTRVQADADWDAWLVDATGRSGAEAVIHLVPKFCEPHMLYYPELRKGLDAAGIPQLQLETEHEGVPLESVRTRVEALVERARRRRAQPTVAPGTEAVGTVPTGGPR